VERRLAAILAADLVGYSRIIHDDETGTLRRLQALRSELIQLQIDSHNGRTFKLMGDGLLAEFSSVVEAVACAIEFQLAIAEREAEQVDENRLQLRIGVHIGDFIIEGTDIYGDGVNIVARLEAAADPGGVCISEDVHRQVEGKLAANFRNLRMRRLKNIQSKMRLFGFSLDPKRLLPKTYEALTGEPLDLPEQPSIAVLPLEDMSDDPAQEYFADGITADIITSMSRIAGLIVLAHTSTFIYKGSAVDVHQVGADLGVHYLLAGSSRKGGNRVRISV
jgi:adenylate cyclase